MKYVSIEKKTLKRTSNVRFIWQNWINVDLSYSRSNIVLQLIVYSYVTTQIENTTIFWMNNRATMVSARYK